MFLTSLLGFPVGALFSFKAVEFFLVNFCGALTIPASNAVVELCWSRNCLSSTLFLKWSVYEEHEEYNSKVLVPWFSGLMTRHPSRHMDTLVTKKWCSRLHSGHKLPTGTDYTCKSCHNFNTYCYFCSSEYKIKLELFSLKYQKSCRTKNRQPAQV